MGRPDSDGKAKESFLAPGPWQLVTWARPGVDAQYQEVVIQGLATDRATRNARFWRLFPEVEPDLREYVRAPGITASVEWSFRPTIRFKERYGTYPQSKIARVTAFWSNQRESPPPAIAAAIDEYRRDQVPNEVQRASAWRELIHERLPEPPPTYFWAQLRREFVLDNAIVFRLWHQSLGYPPASE